MHEQRRVVQWATGNIGGRALREVIRHPDLDLVGVLVYDPAKAGVGAGTLCDETTDRRPRDDGSGRDHALAADCVLYMPRALDVSDVITTLEGGTNIVTTRGEFVDGGSRLDDDTRARVLDACARGGSSVYSTGSSPGFITDALPFALLSMQRRVESIEIDEFANLSRRDSPHLLFEQMGFGKPLSSYNPQRAQYLLGEFGPRSVCSRRPRSTRRTWNCFGEVAAARRATAILAATRTAAQLGCRAAHHPHRLQRRRRRRALQCQLVLHRGRRARVGTPSDGLARARPRRSALRRRPHVPNSAR
jgi:4-hydroxy-tetrahydrodipicolinate reductase